MRSGEHVGFPAEVVRRDEVGACSVGGFGPGNAW